MRKILLSVLMLAALALTLATADAQNAFGGAVGVKKPLTLTTGKAQTIELTQPASEILIANPNVVDVGVLTKQRLYVVGRGVGDTNVLVFDRNKQVLASMDVNVSNDQFTLQRALRQYFPEENIDARMINREVILTGRVSTPSKAGQIRDLSKRFATTTGNAEASIVDLMTVEGEQQVMLQVKIVEAKRNLLKEYGIEPEAANLGFGNFSGSSLATDAASKLTQTTQFAVGSLVYETGSRGPISVTMRALEEKGLLNTLAEPNLTAISGQRAEFLAGGEYPIPVGQSNDQISIEFKQFGVALGFTPVVLSNDKIQLELETEVSLLSNEARLELSDVNVPSLTVRRAKTTVEMASGGSLMIAGLIQSDSVNTMNSLPGVNKIPIIGRLFSSQSFKRNESELLVVVTPYLVRPVKEPAATLAQAPAAMPETVIAAPTHVSTAPVPVVRKQDTPTGRTSSGYWLE